MNQNCNNLWQESEVSISAIQQLLAEGFEVEIDSLDGYVPVSEFVDKGTYEGYELTCGERTVIVNENHLFETTEGWKLTKDLLLEQVYTPIHYLTDSGIEQGYIRKINSLVPIVDLVIDHPNHRYFANGISSHNTNVGKSLFLTDQSAHYLMQNKKVLYITMEMAEEKIAERIDARLMETDLNDLNQIPHSTFMSRIKALREKTASDLIIREYPPHVFNANMLRSLLRELKQKQRFVPDVIALDYLGLCASYRLSPSVGQYQYLKSVTEEMRGVMVSDEYLGLTAMQTNREGQTSADVDLTDMSESHGISMGADFIFAMMAPPELAAMGAYRFKQLKSRFGDLNKYNSFLVGVDKAKMTLYNMDNVDTGTAPTTPPSVDKGKKIGAKPRTQLKT